MQTKGFIRVLTIALLLICAFYLSFTFVSNHYQNVAEQKALAAAGIKSADTSNEKYKAALNECLDSLANEKVYLGYYTFQQVREKELGLGLDLKGGMNVTLQISVPDILRALANNNPDKKFNQAIDNVSNNQTAQDDFVGSFCKEYKKLAPEGSLAQIFRGIERIREKPNANDREVQSILNDEVNSMVDNSYKVLRNRIDRFGVVSPNIQKLQSTGRILLELPGVKEPERVRKLLQGAANLEFYETYTLGDVVGALRQLSDQAQANKTTAAAAADTTATAAAPAAADSAAQAAPKAAPAQTGEKTLAQLTGFEALAGGGAGSPVLGYVSASDTAAVNAIFHSPIAKTILPADLKVAWTVKPEKMQGGQEAFQLVALRTVNGQPVLNGDVVTRATSEFDNLQGQVVSMTMNDEGAHQWSRITGQNIGKAIAIVLDDQVYSFPNVNSQIDGGRSQISGRFTVEEAGDLANVLESGKMVARVNVASESVIGPSLGKESIRKGLISFIIALVLLMIFMVCTYGIYAGSIANLGLLMNLFFTIGILASFQSVLTLPGIAGIVLTLGMAVDANVLIFERCKEELRAGKGLQLDHHHYRYHPDSARFWSHPRFCRDVGNRYLLLVLHRSVRYPSGDGALREQGHLRQDDLQHQPDPSPDGERTVQLHGCRQEDFGHRSGSDRDHGHPVRRARFEPWHRLLGFNLIIPYRPRRCRLNWLRCSTALTPRLSPSITIPRCAYRPTTRSTTPARVLTTRSWANSMRASRANWAT